MTLPRGGTGYQEVTLKVTAHQIQNSITGAFKEYQENAAFDMTADDIPITSINSGIPIRAIYSIDDLLCPVAANKALLETIPSYDAASSFMTEGGHGSVNGLNVDEYMRHLRAVLNSEAGADMTPEVCASEDFTWIAATTK
eukprot:CAMPEP_0185573164 /NCGR_PEP_ID=MMETSP0434-20130131/4947_1 /TAXON_ID=626734 ORGANISM="Favella taraikaensis, Strain Fe Narragansett Bay" /NCGR_SAMPLE_ID=MMETSP0434 /ASSEMBLY_ACC=CAM_ASM_000379 /LENGTH=140 /DNA_ID=CAMNT_0028189315 /DNA_START=1134 /DNA_END=1555 /DNA_ORIENTATION=+